MNARRGAAYAALAAAIVGGGAFAWRRPPAATPGRAAAAPGRDEGARSSALTPPPPVAAASALATPDPVAAFHAQRARGASAEDLLAALKAIAADQPAVAIELALAQARDGDERGAWVTALVNAWAVRDPEAAWSWLSDHGPQLGPLADAPLLEGVWREMAARDPQLVVKHADLFLSQSHAPGGFAAQIVAQSAIQALLARDAADYACVIVEFWAHSPLGGEVGVGTFTDVARTLAKESPESALSWLRSLPPSQDRNVALGEMAAEGVDRDPAATLQWATGLSPEEGRSTVVERAFAEWTERDAAAAGHWLAGRIMQQAAPAEADAMIVNVVNASSLIRSDPNTALGWVALIGDPDQRAAAHAQVVLRWASIDPAAAQAYLQGDPTLAPDQRAALARKVAAELAAPDRAGPWFAADSVAAPEK